MSRRAWSPRLGVVFGYVCAAVVFTWPLALQMGSAFTGDPGGDTGVYVWNQWVFHHEMLVDRHNPLTTDQVLSLTERVDLSQHNYTAFLNLLALPLIPLIGVVAAFNTVFLIASILTALATYALVRRVTPATRPEAWLAGLLFAWSPVLIARGTGHFSLVAAAPLPAFLLFLIDADRTRRLRCASLAGLCMAWAAFCDVYYAVHCLMIAIGYVALRVVHISRSQVPARRSWRWTLDFLIVAVLGLVVGLLFGRGGRLEVFGVPVSIRGLYTPMLLLSALVVGRVLLAVRPHVSVTDWIPSRPMARVVAVGVLACAGPLTPVIYGLGQRIVEGRFVNPPIFWRSSPRGVDLFGLFEPNPSHPMVRAVRDAQTANATAFVDYTAALSLVALAVVAVAAWRAGYRPRAGWIWLTAGFATLSLGPFLHVAGVNTLVPLPWALLRYVPIVGAARSPARFAVVAALGLAVLFAGALAALGQRHPRRRAWITALAGAVLVFELLPAPRTLYSAEVPSIYHRIAADPRPVRVLQLPFGVRDGVSSAGNFSSRYLYFQTVHGKPLIGGYLSRISKKRLDDVRAQPTLDALLMLSEGRPLAPEHADRIRARAPLFLARSDVGYVVINHARAPKVLVDFVLDAWRLEEIERNDARVLYRPTLISSQ
jgi:hypothetical protein